MGNFRPARLPAAVEAFKAAFDVLPSAYFDFKAKTLFYPNFQPFGFVDIPGASCNRASSATGFVDGVMTEFAADQPRLTDDGLVRVIGVTNKVQAYAKPTGASAGAQINDAPGGAGVLSIVDDAVALVAAGLGDITNGNVYRLDNSAGTGASRIAFNGIFDTTGPACFSSYVRNISGGTGEIKLRTGYGNYPPLPGLTSNFTRFEQSTPNKENGTYQATDSFWVEAQPGEIIHVCLPMAEENRLTASPYAPTDGDAASTDTDQVNFDSVAGLGLDAATQASGYTIIGWIGAHEPFDVAPRILGLASPGATSLINFIGASRVDIGMFDGDSLLRIDDAISPGAPFSFTVTQANGFRGLSIAGSAMVSDNGGSPPFTRIRLGEGGYGGNAMRLIELERLIVIPRLVTAAEAQAMNQWSPS